MSSPKVILVQRVIATYRVPFFQELGRSQKTDFTIATGVRHRMEGLQVVTSPEGFRTLALRNYILGPSDRIVWQSGLLSKVLSRRFDAVIAEFNPRIITNLLACLASKLLGQPFIWWGHGTGPSSSRMVLWLRLWLIARSDALILYDEVGARRFKALGVPPSKLFVATNSIDTEAIARNVQKHPPGLRRRVLYIGRLIPAKKVDLLVRGFALARPELPPDTTLTIIGDGPAKAGLTDLVAELSLESRVEFTGALYDEGDLAPYFATGWISVSPGYVGLSAIHSLAYGVPMLIAREEPHSPEVSALEDGVNAVFIPSDNPEELAQALADLSRRPGYLKSLSEAGLRTIGERYSVQAMARTFEEAVSWVLNRRGKSAAEIV